MKWMFMQEALRDEILDALPFDIAVECVRQKAKPITIKLSSDGMIKVILGDEDAD